MVKIKIIALIAGVAFLLGACGDDSSTGPEPLTDPVMAVNKVDMTLTGNPWWDNFMIINQGGGQLRWEIVEKPDWIDISDVVGRITDDTSRVNLTTRFDQLEYGEYNGSIKITSNGGELTLDVHLLYQAPELKVENSVINMDRHYRRSELLIMNQGGGELSWEITQAPDWLAFEFTEGKVYNRPEAVPFSAQLRTLDYGEYECKVVIESNGGSYEINVFLIYEREVEVYPGVGAALIELGDTYTMVQNQWGKPDRNWYERPEKTLFIHHFEYFDIGLHMAVKTNSLILYGSGTVGFIELLPPYDGMTPELIGIGSSVDSLKAAYGEPTSVDQSYWYYDIGITFVIRSNKVDRMIIKEENF